MKARKILYKNDAELVRFIEQNIDQDECNWLIRIHATTIDRQFCTNVAKVVSESLPLATIVGCNVGGLVFDGNIYDEGTLILFTGFERATVTKDLISIGGLSSAEILYEIANSVGELEPAVAITHFGGFNPHSESVVRNLTNSMPNIPFVGGVAGCLDEAGNIISFVFDETGVYDDSISISYVSKDFVLSYTNSIVGHAPISDVHKITAMSSVYIDEIDGVPGIEWINEQLGTTQFSENAHYETNVATDMLLRFPFVIEGDDGASRFVQYDAQENKIKQYYSSIGAGAEFRLGYVSPMKSVEEWQTLCYNLQNTPVETIFCYSCLFRKLFLNNLSKWEMTPFAKEGICGVFMFGEIGTKNGRTYFYNGTCSMFTMAEKVNYINPDIAAFQRVHELDDTNMEMKRVLSNLVELSSESSEFGLFENAMKSEEVAMSRLQSGKDDMSTFLKGRDQGENQKICVVGTSRFSNHDDGKKGDITLEFLNTMAEYAQNNLADLKLEFYRLDSDSLFFAAENSVPAKLFTEAVSKLFEVFAKAGCGASLLDFAYTLKGKNPRELLESIEELEGGGEPRLINCDENSEQNVDLHREFEIVEIIKDAIKNDRVVPYFQGIYDSQDSRFFAYES